MVDLDLRRSMLEDAAGDARSAACCSTSCSATARTPTRPASSRRWSRAPADGALVIARVCGTDDDPQDARAQTATLERAGAIVAPSNAAAARLAVRAVKDA